MKLTEAVTHFIRSVTYTLSLIETSVDHLTHNYLALDILLADQWGVYAVLNSPCCTYINTSFQVETDVQNLYKTYTKGYMPSNQPLDQSYGNRSVYLSPGPGSCILWAFLIIILLLSLVFTFLITLLHSIGILSKLLNYRCSCKWNSRWPCLREFYRSPVDQAQETV